MRITVVRRDIFFYSQDMFPVDAVYTWVENTDSLFKKKCKDDWEEYCKKMGWERKLKYETLLTDNGELAISLRSIAKYAPWIRNIYIVTNGQVPQWLKRDHPNVTVVTHAEIFPTDVKVPTYNSFTIESYIQNIPGLAEHFISLNDDFFLGCETTPDTFFTKDGLAKNFFSSEWMGREDNGSSPTYIKAWQYSNQLLDEAFSPACRAIPLHQARPMRKSVCEQLAVRFEKEMSNAHSHPFRYEKNLATVSFMAPWWSVYTNKGIVSDCASAVIRMGDDTQSICSALHTAIASKRILLCINEGKMSNRQKAWKEVHSVLQEYFPELSPYEAHCAITTN